MATQFTVTLALISGVCWTLAYIEIIRVGFRDKSYGMPLFALSFNLAWEFLFSVIFIPHGITVQVGINFVWFLFDLVIVYTHLRYSRDEFARLADPKWFLPWTLFSFVIAFGVIYAAAVEFGTMGPVYTAFAQNLMMSLLFIGMLVRREGVEGQSMYVAILKGVGTLAPTIQIWFMYGSVLVLVMGIGCFLADAVYTIMLYRRFQAARLKPFAFNLQPA